MNHLIIEFVINFLYIYIYISAPVNLKIFFSFKEMHLLRIHSTHGKENLLLSIKFKTEEARVNLSDLLPCMFFCMGSVKGEFSPNFSSYVQEIVESFS